MTGSTPGPEGTNEAGDRIPREADAADAGSSELFSFRVMQSAPDALWALAADAVIAALAVELALRAGVVWGLGVAALLVFVLGTQLRLYRFRVAAAAGQVRLAAAMLLGGASLAAFGPRTGLTLALVFAVGAAKLARELIVFVRLARAMSELGRRRRTNPAAVAVALAGVVAGGILALGALLSHDRPASLAAAAFLAGYSLLVAAMELFA